MKNAHHFQMATGITRLLTKTRAIRENSEKPYNVQYCPSGRSVVYCARRRGAVEAALVLLLVRIHISSVQIVLHDVAVFVPFLTLILREIHPPFLPCRLLLAKARFTTVNYNPNRKYTKGKHHQKLVRNRELLTNTR